MIFILLFFLFSLEGVENNSNNITQILNNLTPHANFGGVDGFVEFGQGVHGIFTRPNSTDLVMFYSDDQTNKKLAIVNTNGTITKEIAIDFTVNNNSNDTTEFRQQQVLCDADALYITGYLNGNGYISKYSYDLTPITNFGTNGTVEINHNNNIQLLSLYKTSDNKYYVGGGIEIQDSYTPFIARFNPTTGTLDNTFHNLGYLFNGTFSKITNALLNNMVIVGNSLVYHNRTAEKLYTFDLTDSDLAVVDTIDGKFECVIPYETSSIFTAKSSNDNTSVQIDYFKVSSNSHLTDNYGFIFFNTTLGMDNNTPFKVRSLSTLATNKLFIWAEVNSLSDYPVLVCYDISDISMIHIDTTFFEGGYWFYDNYYDPLAYTQTAHGFLNGLITNSLIPTLLGRTDTKIIHIPLPASFITTPIILSAIRSSSKNMKSRLALEQAIGNTIPFV